MGILIPKTTDRPTRNTAPTLHLSYLVVLVCYHLIVSIDMQAKHREEYSLLFVAHDLSSVLVLIVLVDHRFVPLLFIPVVFALERAGVVREIVYPACILDAI